MQTSIDCYAPASAMKKELKDLGSGGIYILLGALILILLLILF